MSHRNFSLLLAAVVVSLLCFSRGAQDPFARYIVEGYQKIDRLALENVPDRELFEGAMDGMVGVLRARGDEHSQFIAGKVARLFREEISQEIGGIGVRLRFEGDPPLLVVAGPPLPGKPAERAGIERGDRILAIDGKSTIGLSTRDFSTVLDRMRGRPAEPLELLVQRAADAEPYRVTLVREKLTLESLRGDKLLADQSWQYLLDEDPRIALVRLVLFGSKSVGELEALLPELVDAGAEALILDLRENPGGPLDAAIATCELFLPAGKLVVETRDRYGNPRAAEFTTRDGPYVDMPLVVLVNRNSASASEIVAGCLQDHDRAVVIGERSFGKGTVQEMLPIEPGERSYLKLTRASFWRPSGLNIHRSGTERDPDDSAEWGIRPNPGMGVELDEEAYRQWATARGERDITVPDPDAADQTLFNDEAVDLAVAVLQEQLGGRDQGSGIRENERPLTTPNSQLP